MAFKLVKAILQLDTKAAKKEVAKFGTFSSQLFRASASAANSQRSSLGARQIGGGIVATAVGTAVSGPVGQVAAGTFGALNRFGAVAAEGLGLQNILAQFNARNVAFNRLRGLAAATAEAGGSINTPLFDSIIDYELTRSGRESKGVEQLKTKIFKKDEEFFKSLDEQFMRDTAAIRSVVENMGRALENLVK